MKRPDPADKFWSTQPSERAGQPGLPLSVTDTGLLYETSCSFDEVTTVAGALAIALDAFRRCIGIERAAVYLLNHEGCLRCEAFRGLSPAFMSAFDKAVPWPPAPNAGSRVLPLASAPGAEGEGASVATTAVAAVARAENIAACLLLPLRQAGKLLGMVALCRTQEEAFGERVWQVGEALARHLSATVSRTQPAGARHQQIERLTETILLNERFTGILGHHLRNPLQSMLTGAEVLVRRSPDPKIATTAKRIASAGNRMNLMIEQLLEFTRIRANGRVRIEPATTDIAAIWQEAVEACAAEAAVRIRFDQRGDTSGTWDPSRLGQVAANLTANAVRHGSEGTPVAIEIDGTNAAAVIISIHNGGAMPPEVLQRLFDPLKNAEGSRASGEGLGLGLFITREILKAHGGSIDVTSSPADGTAFTVRLPREFAEPREGEVA